MGEWVGDYGTCEVTVKGPNLIRELGKGGIVVICCGRFESLWLMWRIHNLDVATI